MQDWKMTDKVVANFEENYWVWKMTDHFSHRMSWKNLTHLVKVHCE